MPDSSPPTAERLPHRSFTPAARPSAASLSYVLNDCTPGIDMVALRAYRLGRIRAELRARDYAGILLYDPVNIRYASGSRNMSVWTTHNAVRYLFVPTEGPLVLFDFHNCEHLSEGLETIAEVRPAKAWYYFGAGPRVAEQAKAWAAEIADLVTAHGGGNRRLAADRLNPEGAAELAALGVELRNGEEITELARRIKSAEEIACMTQSVAVCEVALARLQAAIEPGITENQLWSHLHQVNIALGGEWIETRLLSSGERTNPWFREAGERIIRPGDLIGLDTDMIGPFGYCADVSRTFFCGPGRPSDEQRRLYRLALEQVSFNQDLLKPGLGFREFVERSWEMPESCKANRYSVVLHGVGLADEYPSVVYAEDFAASGYDGVFEPGMTVCVESYMGEEGGREGVKLEQQVLITETGVEPLSRYPWDEALLPREI